MSVSPKKRPTDEELAEKLEEFYYLTFDQEETTKAAQYIAENANRIADTDRIFYTYQRLMFSVIRTVEMDKKISKRICAHMVVAVQDHPKRERYVKWMHETLLNLPMLIQCRWDLLTLMANARLLDFDDFLYEELWACASDQNMAARCSSAVIHLSCTPSTIERMSQLMCKGLYSPVTAIRSNVQRSWLGRILNSKSSEKCVERVLELLRQEAAKHDNKMWPIAFREVCGMTTVDLQWKTVIDEDSCETLSLIMAAYTTVLLTLLNPSCKVKVKLQNDDPIITRGITYYCSNVARSAFIVCAKYKIAPRNLEQSALFETTSGRMLEIFEIIDDFLLKKFSKEGQLTFTREKCKYNHLIETEEAAQKEEQSKGPVKKQPKFFPAIDNGKLRVETRMSTEGLALKTLNDFLKVQSTEKYPSVARVMEHLGNQEIDHRLFTQKISIMSTLVLAQYRSRKFSRKVSTEFLFNAITQIPLRALVDHIGELITGQCKTDEMFREKIFLLSYELIQEEDENARPLSLGHCLRASVINDEVKVASIWQLIKAFNVGEKKRKLCEMFATVISHSTVTVYEEDLYDMLLCTLGFVEFGVESTQLFVAALCRLLRHRHETDRIMLFAAFDEDPDLLVLINQILDHPPADFSNSSFQMVLYLFTRFQLGSYEFYEVHQLPTVARIVNFCYWCIRKFAGSTMYLGLAVDAICGFLPWGWIRERILHPDVPLETDDPVEKLIAQNLRHHHLWVLLTQHERKMTEYMTMEDFEHLPHTELIREIKIAQQQGMTDIKRAELVLKLRNSLKEECCLEALHAYSFAFGMFADELRELISKLKKKNVVKVPHDWKHRHHIFTSALVEIGTGFETCSPEYNNELTNSWLGKALGKLQDLTDYLNY